jgi:phage terminase large subunit
MKRININSACFNRAYRRLFTTNKRVNLIFGGSSSGKSFSVAFAMVMQCLEGRNILYVRQTLVSMTDSCWAEIKNIIEQYNLGSLFRLFTSSKRIECINGNSGVILFKGLDDPERIKSIRGKRALDTIIVEEASQITEEAYNQLLLRQRGQTKFAKRIFLVFNPVNITSWIYRRFFEPLIEKGLWNDKEYEDDNLWILKTTYLDNKFLTQDDLYAFEDMKIRSPYHYTVYALGHWGSFGSKIFTTIEVKPVEIDRKLRVYIGCDLGFKDDSTSVICQVDDYNKTITIIDECGGVELLPEQFTSKIKNMLSVNKLPHNTQIQTDTNEPRLVSQMRNLGLNMSNANKGGGSVLPSYMWMMQYNIIINSKCVKTIESFKSIEWQKDKNGNDLEKPVHTYTHYVDAVRYATEKLWSVTNKVVTFSKSKLY